MKTTYKRLLILLSIILSLALLTACQYKTSPAVPQNSQETTEAEKIEEQDQKETDEPQQPQPAEEEPAEATAQTSQNTPVSAPAEPQPADPEKQESSQPKPDDKTSLHIEGSCIENPITLSLDDLKAMQDAYYEDDFFSLNSFGTKEYFHFKGVRIKAVLDRTVIKDGAASISFVASDGYKHEMTLEQALKEDYIDEQDPNKKYPVIIAWHENGNDYDTDRGTPFRLVIGQKEPGDVNKPQWVQNIARIIID